ncbi:ankyrin repeat domain-containing protein [Burkholderia arboris]|uniref:ankyrin repeat domain-containing protein n=1 Tax=Burkholderia arboris TaxID=488730 RepID=UPI0018C66801|nr:ankyrin repeat domain-containing protein [Burkholderia arboris]MCA8494328.1 ankyrin repeat domain-containing protein [Burkholderia arboris]
MKAPLSEQLKSILRKYETHPDFLGFDLTDPNQKGAVDDTVLHLATRTGALDDVRVLVDAGANVNSIGDLGNTPLHQAAMMGQLESARLLLKCGAATQAENEFGQTPLEVAKLSGSEEMIRLLGAGR